jgi:hypothetical protein
VYLDFAFNGSASLLLSLHNSVQQQSIAKREVEISTRLAFLRPINSSAAAPISLLARVDDEEYMVLPNAFSIVAVRQHNLDSLSRHEIRIVAPISATDALQTIQIEGVWIDEGGQLLPPGSNAGITPVEGLHATKHGLSGQSLSKMLEIVTDLPGSVAGREKKGSHSPIHDILSGVLGWEYLVGDMFGADHVTIGTEGMCLIQECIGGKSSPIGIADVFFQRYVSCYVHFFHG